MPLSLQTGDVFPDMTLPDQGGEEVSIEDLAGRSPLILAFYRGPW